MRSRSLLLGVVLALAAVFATGCKERPPRVPGETDIHVMGVAIEPAAGSSLTLPHEKLFERLGERPGSAVLLERTYSEFREAEDRRRIEAFWQTYGFFDVEVTPAEVTFSPDKKSVRLAFHVKENQRYAIASVHLEHAPPEEEPALRETIVFREGEHEIDLERFRRLRLDMADRLRRDGYGHANVYSRTYVDRSQKAIHWYYLVDAGPKTRIGTIKVDGNRAVPAERIVERAGIKVGDPYREGIRDTIPMDLLDTGSFSSSYVRVDTDTKFVVPGTAPDPGGELRDEQVDEQGNLVPRKLPEDVTVTLHVVEAPSETVRLKAGFEIDPARADASLGATLWARNLFGPMRHLVVEGGVGYGILIGGSVASPGGPYGELALRQVFAGALGRVVDLRITEKYKGSLYPGAAYLHELAVGPGLRATLEKGLFFDLDLLATGSRAIGFGPFSDADRAAYALSSTPDSHGAELDAGLVWDERETPAEPMKGHLFALRGRVSPKAPWSSHGFYQVLPEARVFLPLREGLSIGLRAEGAWTLGAGDTGLPLGARLFGGGAYGFRGWGRQVFSPVASTCLPASLGASCRPELIGGQSLANTSLELRFLPVQKQYGAVLFGDLGCVGAAYNPFEAGVSVAAGVGLRLRLWYLPAAFDFAYRAVDRGRVQGTADSPFLVFFRVGEAF